MEQPTRKKLTLADLARLSGVSKMTVSRALRHDPNVSAGTREMVLRVAERENYVPAAARGGGSTVGQCLTRQFQIVFQDEYSLTDAFFGEIIRSIHHELAAEGHRCSLSVIKGGYDGFLKLYEMMQSGDVDGILAVGPISSDYLNVLIERFRRLVLVDNPGGPELSKPYSSVSCDTVHGCALAVRHLVALNRRRILLILGPEDIYFFKEMLQGYRATLELSGIELDPALIVQGGAHVDGGYQATKSALRLGLKFDAVYSNDEMACGAIKALTEAEIDVPDEVSVAGYDNLLIGEVVDPPLTTVAVDRERMSQIAVQLLLKLIDGVNDPSAFCKHTFFPSLVIRDSCGADSRRESARNDSD